MLSPQGIDEHIAFITAALERLTASGVELSQCADVAARFGALRQQYLQRPESLTARVQELSALSTRPNRSGR